MLSNECIQFLKKIHLHLLDIHKPLPLIHEEMVYLFVEVANFQFRLEIDTIVVLGLQPIFGFLTVLAHHDDRSLDRGQAGQHQVEKNKGIWIDGLCQQQLD